MMEWITKDMWRPADGFVLEEEALRTAINNENTLVVAGPGAGKTELLAQRACFLLETNVCTYPRKILAISFKKDAAKNLKERVELRCGKNLASRFESKTYDAFAKEILDRFRESLVEEYRPLKDYIIANNDEVKKAFIFSGMPNNTNNRSFKEFYSGRLSVKKLPLESKSTDDIFVKVWKLLLKGNQENDFSSEITFEMISRLAEFLIRSNEYIKKAIVMTYSHVFLDEFQDTTTIQYDLIKTCFYQSQTIVTAVGDSKQRIMLWAGARVTIFEDFLKDFKSNSKSLIMNHRSAPKLVEIQKSMYNLLNEAEIELETNDKWSSDDGEAYLRIFSSHLNEAEVISNEIRSLIENGVRVNEICILVKQQVEVYAQEIINKLSDLGVTARNEALYQDLLKEDIIRLLLSIFKLAIHERSPDDWEYYYGFMTELYGFNEDSNVKEVTEFVRKLDRLVKGVKSNIAGITKSRFRRLVYKIINKIPYSRIVSNFTQYQSKEYFTELVNDFIELVWIEYEEFCDWHKAIDNFEGKNSIPIMTIHKSKGLEFDTIFFVGLEDAAFWNFQNQPNEDRCAFFVALSRAKRRIDFTFSSNRPTQYTDTQSHNVINEFYDLFANHEIIKRIDY